MSEDKQRQIVALGQLGWTLRRIEEAVGVRRETAGKYLRQAGIAVRPPGQWGRPPPNAAIEASAYAAKEASPRNASQLSLCEAHRAEIAAAVDKGVCAKVIWEELASFKGSYASVKRFVRRLRAESDDEDSGVPAGIIDTKPGQEAQVDYGQGPLVRDTVTGKYRRSRLFVMTLGWSRKSIWLLTLSSSNAAWAELHELAFRRLGGAPRIIVLDNLAEGVKKADFCDPTLNPYYRQLLAHYDVTAVPARVRDPDRKGKVERGVGYGQLRVEHRKFEALTEAQEHLDAWSRDVADARVHGTTKRIVSEHFDEERSHLQPLPLEPCRRFAFVTRKVSATGAVEVDSRFYPAPATHVSSWVQVQHDDKVVRIVDQTTGTLLVEHRREAIAGGRAPSPEANRAKVSSSSAALVQRARELGPHIVQLCEAIAAVDIEEIAQRRIRSVLRLTQRHGVDHVEVACKVAVEAGAPTHRLVCAWLEHHPPPALTQIDPLIRELTTYRDVVARRTSSTTEENS